MGKGMESSSCYCWLDVEPVKLHKVHHSIARKDYKCEECGDLISKGTKYYRHKFIHGGHWDCVINCAICEQIRDDYGCGVLGDLHETVMEALGVGIK